MGSVELARPRAVVVAGGGTVEAAGPMGAAPASTGTSVGRTAGEVDVDASRSALAPGDALLGPAAAVRPIQPSTTSATITAPTRTTIGPHADARRRARRAAHRDSGGRNELESDFVSGGDSAMAAAQCESRAGGTILVRCPADDGASP